MPESSDHVSPLLIEQRGGVVTLTNNDAPRNRMSLEYMDSLEKEIERIAGDSSIRAVVITGREKNTFP